MQLSPVFSKWFARLLSLAGRRRNTSKEAENSFTTILTLPDGRKLTTEELRGLSGSMRFREGKLLDVIGKVQYEVIGKRTVPQAARRIPSLQSSFFEAKYTLSREVFRVGRISSKSCRRGSDGLTRTVCGSLSRPLRRRCGPVNLAMVGCEHILVGPFGSNCGATASFPTFTKQILP